MLARTVTHALVGLEPRRVEVEAHLQLGAPAFAIVGLADRACQEAKERVRSGIASAELEWPGHRIIVNLAPADLRKEGSGFDLPIALAVLAASRQIPPGCLAGHAAVGELALDGRLRPVPGSLVAAEGARRNGAQRLVCAAESGAEVALAGIEPVPVRHLAEAVATSAATASPPRSERRVASSDRSPPPPDLADVRGQERARRVLEIAAAGGHNLLLAGPPGIGKTMLARRLPGDPAAARRRGGARGHADPLGRGRPRRPASGLIRTPPFRAPHHTASAAAIVGGGVEPAARRGDARPSRRPAARRAAGVPAARARGAPPAARGRRRSRSRGSAAAALFPARFQLVGTMNLCPCGGRGDARCRLLLLAAAARPLPRQALAGAARPLRPRRRAAAAARSRARGAAGRGLATPSAARVVAGARRARRRAPELVAGGRASCSAAPSSGCRSRAAAARASRGSSRTIAALAGRRTVAAGARRRGALVSLARRSSERR